MPTVQTPGASVNIGGTSWPANTQVTYTPQTAGGDWDTQFGQTVGELLQAGIPPSQVHQRAYDALVKRGLAPPANWYRPGVSQVADRAPASATGPAPAPPAAEERNLHAELARDNPWMPAPIIDLWNHLIVVEGLSMADALARVRASDLYEQHFPGNRRPDGSVRNSEEKYMALWEGHSLRLQSYGLNPEAFREQIANLIEFGVSPAEFDNRLQMVQNGIIDALPEVRAWYAANYGIDVSDEQIFASLIDPAHADAIVQGRIDVALVGGSAAAFGFNRSLADVERITATPGFNPESAYGFYADAQTAVSRFDAFARRHGDIDTDVDIAEWEEAGIMADPAQRARFQRLLSQERSSFSQGPAFREDNEGGVVGLRAR